MDAANIQNANPLVYAVTKKAVVDTSTAGFKAEEEGVREPVTREEIFEYIRHLNDPEHPLTLEQADQQRIIRSQRFPAILDYHSNDYGKIPNALMDFNTNINVS